MNFHDPLETYSCIHSIKLFSEIVHLVSMHLLEVDSEGTYTLLGASHCGNVSATHCSAGTCARPNRTRRFSRKWSDFGYYVGSALVRQNKLLCAKAETLTQVRAQGLHVHQPLVDIIPHVAVGGQNVDSSVNTAAVNQTR